MINGIKMLKFNTWENVMFEEVKKLRSEEAAFLRRLFLIKGIMRGLTNFMPLLAGLGCFWLYNHYNKVPLTIAKTYSLIALFNGFVDPIQYGMGAYDATVKALVSNQRIKKLLMIDSADSVGYKLNDDTVEKGTIMIDNAEFKWTDEGLRSFFES